MGDRGLGLADPQGVDHWMILGCVGSGIPGVRRLFGKELNVDPARWKKGWGVDWWPEKAWGDWRYLGKIRLKLVHFLMEKLCPPERITAEQESSTGKSGNSIQFAIQVVSSVACIEHFSGSWQAGLGRIRGVGRGGHPTPYEIRGAVL